MDLQGLARGSGAPAQEGREGDAAHGLASHAWPASARRRCRIHANRTLRDARPCGRAAPSARRASAAFLSISSLFACAGRAAARAAGRGALVARTWRRHRGARGGRQPAAQTWVDELARIAADLPAPSPATQGYALFVAAERERLGGDSAREAWRAAETAWRAAGEPYPLAYALLRIGEAELAGGDRRAATAAVRESAELARRLGAEPLAAEAATLARLGRLSLEADASEAAAPAEPTPFGLTDRELEVLRLIAAGQRTARSGARCT
jgi:hypothetical protein